MNIKTHLIIANKIINNNKKDIKLNFYLPFFYLGTILPDIIASYKVHPHFYEDSKKYIDKKIEKIEATKKISVLNSIRAGIIVHYLCDFCCYAHIKGSFPSLKKHFKYENDIWKYIKGFELSEVCIDKVDKKYSINSLPLEIDNELFIYRSGNPSIQWDVSKAIELSSIVFNSLFTYCKN